MVIFLFPGPRAAFEAALAAKGVRCETLAFYSREQRRRSEDAKIAELVRSWPKPVAVFAGNDHWAYWLASLSRMHGLQVPDEVAILGVDNDELICEFSHPPLSSIAVPAEESGYRGAVMLAQCLKQQTRQVESVLLAPRCGGAPASTEIYLTSDRLVNQVQRFMGEHLTER